jgi:RNA polymerase sigma factor (sigma-70 family)
MGKSDFAEEDFHKLLRFLSPDEEEAAMLYESLRHKLIKLFSARGCHVAEELADETIDRVIKKIHDKKVYDLKKIFIGDITRYFYGVGKNVWFEWQREKKTLSFDEYSIFINQTIDINYALLESTLELFLNDLPEKDKDLVIRYYNSKPQERKKLAAELGINYPALRKQVSRIVSKLRDKIGNELKIKI